MTFTGFGASVPRKEDPALLRGEGQFVDDIHLPEMLHAAFVSSPHAHAKVGRIDKSAALAVPGVHAVLTFADLPESVRRQTLPLLVPHPAIRQAVHAVRAREGRGLLCRRACRVRDRGEPLHRGGRARTGWKSNTSRCPR